MIEQLLRWRRATIPTDREWAEDNGREWYEHRWTHRQVILSLGLTIAAIAVAILVVGAWVVAIQVINSRYHGPWAFIWAIGWVAFLAYRMIRYGLKENK